MSCPSVGGESTLTITVDNIIINTAGEAPLKENDDAATAVRSTPRTQQQGSYGGRLRRNAMHAYSAHRAQTSADGIQAMGLLLRLSLNGKTLSEALKQARESEMRRYALRRGVTAGHPELSQGRPTDLERIAFLARSVTEMQGLLQSRGTHSGGRRGSVAVYGSSELGGRVTK